MLSYDIPLTRKDFYELLESYMAFVDKNLLDNHDQLHEHLSALRDSFPNQDNIEKRSYGWNIEKVKILFELLKLGNRDEAEKVLFYMEHIRYGWKGNRYILQNRCLRFDHHCKRNFRIDNTPEATQDAFEAINGIFLDKECGKITTYLFGYCLAALFSSRLKQDDLRVPYFLQIACERNSNLYRLIHEIVDICDVNTSLLEECDRVQEYGYCDYDYTTVFPTQQTEKALEDLVCNRDIPVIIDGYENEKFYAAMLREIANIPGKKKVLGIKDRFNILPVFICPVIRVSFRNVFNMSLTDFDVSAEYLELIQKSKQRLASWALELVKDATEYFTPRQKVDDVILRKTEDERPFFDNISKHINQIRKRYRRYTELNLKDITNIGFLTYFLYKFMDVFNHSIMLTEGTEFEYKGVVGAHNTAALVSKIFNQSIDSLAELHNSNSPMLIEKVSINTKDLDSAQERQVKKKGEEYAKNIVKYYQSYGVSIKILPDAEHVDGRYIFHVELLPGTDKNLISLYADNVRRLLDLEFFRPDVSHSAIRIIASKEPLKENSLINILESPEFMESKKQIPYAVGYDLVGEMVIADIAKFPHLMIGGTTGSGKSSALHSLLMSVVSNQHPDRVKLLLIDFGASRLNMFANVPHLLRPVVTVNEVKRGRQYISALRDEMMRRLVIFEHNEKELDKLASIICVIDEFPTFIRAISTGKGNAASTAIITNILELARKVKIHMILAAQDSTKDNIGIKMTNLAAGIAFKCKSWHHSKPVIGAPDAINLFGKGSMYFTCDEHEGLLRVQGAYMEPDEIRDRLQNMKFDRSNGERFELEGLDEPGMSCSSGEDIDSENKNSENNQERVLAEIMLLALKKMKISNKQIKDNFGMGYDRAQMFIDELETLGIVSKQKEGAKLSRLVIPERIEDLMPDVIELLERNGCTKDDIINAFNQRPKPNKTAAQSDSGVSDAQED